MMPARTVAIADHETIHSSGGAFCRQPVYVLFKADAAHVGIAQGRTLDVNRDRGTVVPCGAVISTRGSFYIG